MKRQEHLSFGHEVRVKDNGGFPLIIEANRPDFDMAAWAVENTDRLRSCTREYGAVLLRQATEGTPDRFVEFAEAVCPVLITDYGDLGADDLTDKTYSPTDYPLELPIHLHNESACNNSWPMFLFFYCHQPAFEGGASRLVNSRRVFAALPEALRQSLTENWFTYTRNYHPHLDTSWQQFYETDDPRVVEQRCMDASLDFEWKSAEILQTRCDRPIKSRHPHTGEELLFHQLFLFHPAGLDAATRNSLESLYGEEDFPRAISFQDGAAISADDFQVLFELYEKHCVDVELQRGDILIIDNMVVAHGRAPFRGSRKILVAMGDMVDVSQPGDRALSREHQPANHRDAFSRPIARTSYPSVVAMFRERAQQSPESAAICRDGASWTYGKTASFAEKVASAVAQNGVVPGQTVAVVGESSFEAIAAILGVWMAGAIVLPLDSSAPPIRMQSQLRSAGCRLLVNAGEAIADPGNIPLISTANIADGEFPGFAPIESGPDDPAYIFFTSGTTGEPKGIRGLHGGLSHFLCWQRDTFEISDSDRFAQLTSLSFDVMLRDIFTPLVSGSTLVLPPGDIDRTQPWAWLRQDRITAIHVVPSLMASWLAVQGVDAECPSLRVVFQPAKH
jgi:alpha-ketoglutarate-dependent taurine dioxygenase